LANQSNYNFYNKIKDLVIKKSLLGSLRMKYVESETLELKKSTSELDEAINSIVAILNKHNSGEVIFGINSKGKVIGQDISEKTLRNISQKIANSIEPRIYPKIEKHENIIKISFSGKQTPYFAYSRSYMRVADEDRLMSAKELENFILTKNKDKIRWDNDICESASLDDIDEEKLKNYTINSELAYTSKKEVLENLELIRKDKLTNSSILFFGKKTEKFFRLLNLRCAVFLGKDTASKPIDMKDFYGDLFQLIDFAEKYILQHINIGMKIEGMRRIDIPEINKEAFREAIINAFCHRDYSIPQEIQIVIFKDRVEIRNPGELFGGLTIKDILTKKISKRRNPLIADIFHRIHFIEKWGTGIGKIKSFEKNVKFEVISGFFYTIFPRNNILEKEKSSEKTTLQTTPQTTPKLPLNSINCFRV
jgi:ATP-dependent DNA helicase RecG